jgi:hypothetical protein
MSEVDSLWLVDLGTIRQNLSTHQGFIIGDSPAQLAWKTAALRYNESAASEGHKSQVAQVWGDAERIMVVTKVGERRGASDGRTKRKAVGY